MKNVDIPKMAKFPFNYTITNTVLDKDPNETDINNNVNAP